MNNSLNLIGQTVRHKTWGEGRIIQMMDASHVTVEFKTKTSTFQYPGAFEQYLIFEDVNLQSEALRLLQEKKDALEAERLEKERKHAEEIKRQELEKQAVIEKTFVPINRTEGTVFTFYCNQWIYYEPEAEKGIIWAPLYAADGRSLYYWDNLLNVRKGDILIHSSGGYMRAISRAEGSCYDLENPFSEETIPLLKENVSNYREGRAVNCDYVILKNPIPTADYKEDILKYSQDKYAPFDKNGDGNAGYLFDLRKELATVFMHGILEKNPDIADLDYIQWML